MKPEQPYIFLVGGKSTEFDASLHSYRAFKKSLDQDKEMCGYCKGLLFISRKGQLYWHDNLSRVDEDSLQQGSLYTWPQALEQLLKLKSYCFSLLHGNEGEDGAFQGMAEVMGIKGSFGPVFAASFTMNKWALTFAVPILTNAEIFIPKTFIADRDTNSIDLTTWISENDLEDVVVKPNSMGASLFTRKGKAVAHATLMNWIRKGLKYDRQVLVQEYIVGDEYTCGIIEKGNDLQALPIILARSTNRFLGHNEKHSMGMIDAIFCEYDDPVTEVIPKAVKQLFKVLGLSNMARFDLIYSSQDKQLYFLECNSIPGFGEGSAFPQMLEMVGLSRAAFLRLCISNEQYRRERCKEYKYKITH